MDEKGSDFSKDDDLGKQVDAEDRLNILTDEKLVSRRAALLRIGLGVGAIMALASVDHKAISDVARSKAARSNPNATDDPSSGAENTGSSSSSSSSSGSGIRVTVIPGGLDSTWTNSSVNVSGFAASVKHAPASSAWAAQWAWNVSSAPGANLAILPSGGDTNAKSAATLVGRFPNPGLYTVVATATVSYLRKSNGSPSSLGPYSGSATVGNFHSSSSSSCTPSTYSLASGWSAAMFGSEL